LKTVRVATAPAPLLHGTTALPPQCVNLVVLNPGEEVRWIWMHTPTGSYVTGYSVVKPRRQRRR